jgi:hypothetical protein
MRFKRPAGGGAGAQAWTGAGSGNKIDEPVKSQKPDGFAKSSSYGAQISAA